MTNFDAIIIGSGQAGTPLAFKFASQKMRVAFIEKEHFGGTFLNEGCTPTKAYVASARRMFDVQNGEPLGIQIPEGAVANLKKIRQRKDDLIHKSVDGLTGALENNEYIDVYRGTAKFTGKKSVRVNDTELTADKIFINVGARARIPEGFEDVNVLTNKEILQLDEIPEHLMIVGGSYIGLEFGQMFRRFGSRVTIIEKGERLIYREDAEVSQAMKSGKNIKTGFRKMLDVARAREKGETDGFMRVLIDSETQQILGATVFGVGGDEIISSILNVMYAEQPYTLIRDSVQIHPTVSELIPTMLESLQSIKN